MDKKTKTTKKIQKKEKDKNIKIPKTKVQKLKLKHKKLIFIIVLLLIIFIGMFFIKTTQEETKIDNKEEKVEEKKEEPKVTIVDLESKSRPYAVMINNIDVARTVQSGLQDAFIIYEIIVEGGITRYLALFQDTNTERIGSIRSARHYYLDYALENDAIYVHHGNSPQAKSDFYSLGIDRIEVSTPSTGWRDKTLKISSEHTLFTSIELLKNGLGNKRTERNKDYLLNYKAEEINLNEKEGSQVANKVTIPYSNASTTSYTYNSEDKMYYRFVNNKEHTDYVTKEQYKFKNIITYQVKNYTLNDSENKGRQGINNIGSGEGYYITNGYAIKINWKKDCRECQTVYSYANGEEINVNDGNTFIQIQPSSKKLTINGPKENVEES